MSVLAPSEALDADLSRVDQQPPELVVVGAASRDLASDDPRGWRLGGGVTYSALLAARLGVRVGVLLGVDALAADAAELALLRDAGARIVQVPLADGPVFRNVETAAGRRQDGHSACQPMEAEWLPASWQASAAFLLTPVAAELDDTWAAVPEPRARVGLAWQGLLRRATSGQPVEQVPAQARPLFARADFSGVSPDDLRAGSEPLAELLPRPGQELVLTLGDRGALWWRRGREAFAICHVPAVAARDQGDPVGAGDSFLAAWLIGRLGLGLLAGRPLKPAQALHCAAVVASLATERIGLDGVVDRQRLRQRLGEIIGSPRQR
ncbi:hypothetical protein BH20CHL6_BH20CHL6_11660 [soil metagenome]